MALTTEKIYVVTEERADTVIATEISRTGSDTRRALDGWALEGGGLGGGGGTGGGAVFLGESPVRMTDLGDGTAYIETVTTAATLTPGQDGTYVELAIIQEGTA